MTKIIVDTAEVHTVEEASELLGIGYATLYRWIKSGKIIPLRVSGHTFIPQTEIDRLKAQS